MKLKQKIFDERRKLLHFSKQRNKIRKIFLEPFFPHLQHEWDLNSLKTFIIFHTKLLLFCRSPFFLLFLIAVYPKVDNNIFPSFCSSKFSCFFEMYFPVLFLCVDKSSNEAQKFHIFLANILIFCKVFLFFFYFCSF